MADLHNLITPQLLRDLAHARRPWRRTDAISGNAMINDFMSESNFTLRAAAAWPALLALSRTYGPSTIPDTTRFLPPPASDAFPEQALGLHVLLDQCPRVLFRGAHGRWTSWFDSVVRRLYGYFHALPAQQRPWARQRWADASFEYWFCVASEFNASMAHQESRSHQGDSAAFMGELRCAVEAYAGVRDPNGDDEGKWTNVYAFPRVVMGVDVDRHWSFHEAAFLIIEVHEVHKPVIDRYGRYPYRNAIEGRCSTEEEREWVEETDHFGEVSLQVARLVRLDVEAGRWRPLARDDGLEEGDEQARINVSSEASLQIVMQSS